MTKGDDLIHTELRKVEVPKAQEIDQDLPGLGQYYCLHCDRHFINTTIRDDHYKTKKHRKRVKMMNGDAPHNQVDADMAAGMGAPDHGPRLRTEGVAMAL
jgi:bud site selection protein 20